jgi:hypothetical protein
VGGGSEGTTEVASIFSIEQNLREKRPVLIMSLTQVVIHLLRMQPAPHTTLSNNNTVPKRLFIYLSADPARPVDISVKR